MKKYLFLALFLSLIVKLTALAQSIPDPTGLWETEGGKSIVKISSTPEKSGWLATIVWLKEKKDKDGNILKDTYNPDPNKKNQELIGLCIAWGFKPSKDKDWKGGQVYDPETGKTYKAQAKMKDDKLELRGYIGIPSLGRSTNWTQVSKIPED